MRPRELMLIWEIGRTGSVTQAAERLSMSQPAASVLIRHLEARLGFALFDRDRRRLQLSARGRTLLPEIVNTLSALESLSRLSESLRRNAPRRVVIGSVANVAATLLPAAVRALRKDAPDTLVSVRTAMSPEIEIMVEEGRVDVGLVIRDAASPTLQFRRITPLPLYAVAQPTHPIARYATVSIDTIAKGSYVSLGRAFTIGGAAARMLESRGLRYAPSVEVMHFSAACAFAREDHCVAILDALSVFYAPDYGLIARPIRNAPALGLDLVWSPTSGSATLVDAMADAIGRKLASGAGARQDSLAPGPRPGAGAACA